MRHVNRWKRASYEGSRLAKEKQESPGTHPMETWGQSVRFGRFATWLRRIVATTNPLAQMSDARVEMLSLQVRQRGRRAI
jgi:hypothetical protein